MRFLFIIDSLGSGGAQRQMVTLAHGLKGKGHDVEFFLYAPADHFLPILQQANIPVFQHIKKSRYSFDVLQALRKQIRHGNYDLILSYLPTPNFYAIVSSHLLKNPPPVVISERFYDPPEGLHWQATFPRRFYRYAKHLVINSKHQTENLRQKLPHFKSHISTIYNGLNLQEFSPPKQEPQKSPVKLLSIAHVTPYKNTLCLVRAIAILKNEYGLTAYVNWVGRHQSTSQDAKDYLQQVKTEIKQLEIESQWTWLYEQKDIVGLLHKHHALVHPSYGEGLPNVVCEAMACGRPVIASNTLEHPYLINHGYSGFLFDTHDPYDLAKNIKCLCNTTTAERIEIGRNARIFAEKHFALERFLDDYETLFHEIISQ